MSRRRYLILDVFTREPLAGNPLAVVLDAEDLDTGAMQRLAGEFNLSETVFVLPPADPRHRARIRIFTPRFELPFAGHPTVGSAVALAKAGGKVAEMFVLEEEIGLVRCAVTEAEGATFAEFDCPQLPEALPLSLTPEAVAAALGLDGADVGFENHRPGAWTAGVPYVTVPVNGLDALRRARLDTRLWTELTGDETDERSPGAYLYCRSSGNLAFRTRMLAGHLGLVEDPATGSAAAAFAGAVMRFDALLDGTHRAGIEQGVEMGRPSEIRLELEVQGGELTATRIRGAAVTVASGELLL